VIHGPPSLSVHSSKFDYVNHRSKKREDFRLPMGVVPISKICLAWKLVFYTGPLVNNDRKKLDFGFNLSLVRKFCRLGRIGLMTVPIIYGPRYQSKYCVMGTAARVGPVCRESHLVSDYTAFSYSRGFPILVVDAVYDRSPLNPPLRLVISARTDIYIYIYIYILFNDSDVRCFSIVVGCCNIVIYGHRSEGLNSTGS
jgi:hypothetical protein